jgi:hypothetical protein
MVKHVRHRRAAIGIKRIAGGPAIGPPQRKPSRSSGFERVNNIQIMRECLREILPRMASGVGADESILVSRKADPPDSILSARRRNLRVRLQTAVETARVNRPGPPIGPNSNDRFHVGNAPAEFDRALPFPVESFRAWRRPPRP